MTEKATLRVSCSTVRGAIAREATSVVVFWTLPGILVVESIIVASVDEEVDSIMVTGNSFPIPAVLKLPPEVEICWNGGDTLVPEPLLVVVARGTRTHKDCWFCAVRINKVIEAFLTIELALVKCIATSEDNPRIVYLVVPTNQVMLGEETPLSNRTISIPNQLLRQSLEFVRAYLVVVVKTIHVTPKVVVFGLSVLIDTLTSVEVDEHFHKLGRNGAIPECEQEVVFLVCFRVKRG